MPGRRGEQMLVVSGTNIKNKKIEFNMQIILIIVKSIFFLLDNVISL